MPLIATTSQRYDRLLDLWIENILDEQRTHGPFESQIVVPNHRIASWLNQGFAQCVGVSMNLRFRYLESLLEAESATDGPSRNDSGAGASLTLKWTGHLWQGLRSGAIVTQAHWAGEPGSARSDLQWMQLAWEYAGQLQRIALHRPEWMQAWARNQDAPLPALEHGRLQKKLYQYLLTQGARPHPLLNPALPPANPRFNSPDLHCFGFWTFPPSLWNALETFAQERVVHLYLPFPTAGYLVDLTRQALREPQLLEPDQAPLPQRYQLLSKLGQRGRAMQMRLLDQEMLSLEDFESPAIDERASTRLHQLQAHLTDPDLTQESDLPLSPAKDDSIQIHSTCSLRREVEVVKALIQRSLRNRPDLSLESIQVHAPDIEAYAPAIAEVFGVEEGSSRLAYSIRNAMDADQVPGIRSLLELFGWLGSAWERDTVLQWLAFEPVREALGFSLAELDRIEVWTRAAGIFRGNPAIRAAPGPAAHSWKQGMQRLLQAYAGEVPVNALGSTAFDREPPSDHLETMARWIGCYDWMKQAAVTLSVASQPMESYRQLATQLVHRVVPPSREFEKQVLLSSLNRLAETWPVEEAIDPTTFRYLLRKSLPQLPPPHVLSRKSGIAFASIQWEELTPCRVRILMGMNERDFPAADVRRSHDLLHQGERMPGDPSRREDERYWLLQSIHQTHEQWMVTFQGQDSSGEATGLLSPAVETVLETVSMLAASTNASPAIPIIQHPRFAYDEACFGSDAMLHHYSTTDYDIARSLRQAAVAHAPTSTDATFPQNTATIKDNPLTIWDLARFFKHPNQYVCQQQLGFTFPSLYDDTVAHEPLFWLGTGASYALRSDLLRAQARGLPREEQQSLVESHSAQLPGALRELGFDWICGDVKGIRSLPDLERIRLLESLTLAPVATELLPGHKLHHARVFDALPKEAYLATVRGSNQAEKDEIEAWVHLLAIWMQQEPEMRTPFALIHREGVRWFAAPEDPRQRLIELLEIFLDSQGRPVPFFPKTSNHAIKSIENLQRIEQCPAWVGTQGEKFDPYHAYQFRGRSPFGDAFERLARAVLEPLNACKIRNPLPGGKA